MIDLRAPATTAFPRALAAFAAAGPVLSVALIALTDVLQYDWLVSVGQDPLAASPASVNAWGPWGVFQYAAFTILGLSTLVLTAGLHRVTRRTRRNALNLAPLALVGVSLLADTARCDCEVIVPGSGFVNANPLPGTIHNIGFYVLIPALVAATFTIWWRLRRTPGWSLEARWSLVTGIALIPLFVLGELARPYGIPGFYLFALLGPLQWLTVLARRLLADTVPVPQTRS